MPTQKAFVSYFHFATNSHFASSFPVPPTLTVCHLLSPLPTSHEAVFLSVLF